MNDDKQLVIPGSPLVYNPMHKTLPMIWLNDTKDKPQHHPQDQK